MTRILHDENLVGSNMMPAAIAALEAAFLAKANNMMVSPPRHHVAFAEFGDLVFTVGGILGDAPLAGFRVYDSFDGAQHSQIVAVWSAKDARLQGLILGGRLGCIRTGAIGGIAIRHLSSQDARIVGILGSGAQARSQLTAALAVRPISLALVYSRDEGNRNAFAIEMERDLGIEVRPVDSPLQAVRDADVAICATTSSTPILRAGDLKPGVHVNTVGPKTYGNHELGLDIADVANVIATDAPEQTRAYTTPFFLAGTKNEHRVVDLAHIVSSQVAGRRSSQDVTLFCSAGLAGTEVVVASAIIDLLNRDIGQV